MAEQESVDSKVEAEALAAKLKTAEEERAKAEARAKELQAEIDDAVKRRKTASEKEKEEAAKRGEFETAKKLADEEIAALKAQLADMETLKAKAAQADELIEKQRQALLARIPEDKRDAFKDDSIATLEKALMLMPEQTKVGVDASGKPNIQTGGDKNWYKMNGDERLAWMNGKTPAQIHAKQRDDYANKDK